MTGAGSPDPDSEGEVPAMVLPIVRRRVVVSGEVQGVFFRDSCRAEAVANGVNGWVRNLPDGTVEAVFEGSPETVDRLVRWARQGPPRARVSAVAVAEEVPEAFRSFDVRPSPGSRG
jgi:acylphosphatase